MAQIIHMNGTSNRDVAMQGVLDCPLDGSYEITIKRLPSTRTAKQNRALHKYCGLLAIKLNDAGWSFWSALLRKPMQKIDTLIAQWGADEGEYARGVVDACGWIQESLPKKQVDWTTVTVKEHLWRPVQESIIGKSSTAEANTSEYTPVYENLNRITSETFGVSEQWPSKES